MSCPQDGEDRGHRNIIYVREVTLIYAVTREPQIQHLGNKRVKCYRIWKHKTIMAVQGYTVNTPGISPN